MNQKSPQDQYNELAYYTLSLRDEYFIHQHIVDAFTAQTATEETKPIAITFALAGLYLFVEKGFTGKQVQRMHMKMGKKKREWPKFVLSENRGEITVIDVLHSPVGLQRDEMIKKWCMSVWNAYSASHKKVAALLLEYLQN